GAGMAGAHAAVASPRHPAALIKLDGGDGLIDRAARRDLDNKKLMVMMAHRVGMTNSKRRIR
ncbi:hypothetical protein K24_17695, partial [Klebsiella pneumoniae]